MIYTRFMLKPLICAVLLVCPFLQVQAQLVSPWFRGSSAAWQALLKNTAFPPLSAKLAQPLSSAATGFAVKTTASNWVLHRISHSGAFCRMEKEILTAPFKSEKTLLGKLAYFHDRDARLFALLPANNLAGPALFDFAAPSKALDLVKYTAADAVAALADEGSAVELYAGFGKSVYTAFATIGGNAVGVVATGKQLCHNCVAKASRFVRLCDAFSVPVVTIVDTEGFVPSVTDDVAGGIREAARLAATYADATTAKVAVLAGKAVGPVYTTLAAADLRIAVTGCTVSALEPSAAVSVLYKDEIDASDNIIAATKAKTAVYTAEVCSAASAVATGAADMSCDAANVRASVVAALELLSTKRAARLPKKHGNMAL